MFGEMTVEPILAVGFDWSVEKSVEALVEMADNPTIERWVTFPHSVLLFLVAPEDPSSGAIYLLDRKRHTWCQLDFNDDKFGGYTVEDFERLLEECSLLNLVERPGLLRGNHRWVLKPGHSPEVPI